MPGKNSNSPPHYLWLGFWEVRLRIPRLAHPAGLPGWLTRLARNMESLWWQTGAKSETPFSMSRLLVPCRIYGGPDLFLRNSQNPKSPPMPFAYQAPRHGDGLLRAKFRRDPSIGCRDPPRWDPLSGSFEWIYLMFYKYAGLKLLITRDDVRKKFHVEICDLHNPSTEPDGPRCARYSFRWPIDW
jgi:hypothetical protein